MKVSHHIKSKVEPTIVDPRLHHYIAIGSPEVSDPTVRGLHIIHFFHVHSIVLQKLCVNLSSLDIDELVLGSMEHICACLL
jgi:hypothetical protein